MLTEKDNVIYFDNDNDFFVYAVKPDIIIRTKQNDTGDIDYYRDFEFTDVYNNAVQAGKVFVIKDPNSNICKHQEVGCHAITKPVQNLEPYYGFLDMI